VDELTTMTMRTTLMDHEGRAVAPTFQNFMAYGDGRWTLSADQFFAWPPGAARDLTIAQCRALIGAFANSGRSVHSPRMSTAWVILAAISEYGLSATETHDLATGAYMVELDRELRCNTCNRVMTKAENWGGDCVYCMADSGDPEAKRIMQCAR
jgi:hypothetical protein